MFAVRFVSSDRSHRPLYPLNYVFVQWLEVEFPLLAAV